MDDVPLGVSTFQQKYFVLFMEILLVKYGKLLRACCSEHTLLCLSQCLYSGWSTHHNYDQGVMVLILLKASDSSDIILFLL